MYWQMAQQDMLAHMCLLGNNLDVHAKPENLRSLWDATDT